MKMKKQYLTPTFEEVNIKGMSLLAGSVMGGGDATDIMGGGADPGIIDPQAPPFDFFPE